MKRKFTAAIIILVVSCFAFGQARSSPNYGKSSDEKTLLRIEAELSDALINYNDSVFEKYTADDLVFLPPFSDMMNKSQLMEMVKYNFLRTESSKRSEYKIKINAQTAVVVYRSDTTGLFKFVDISGQYEWIDIFEKREGTSWQLVYEKGTKIR